MYIKNISVANMITLTWKESWGSRSLARTFTLADPETSLAVESDRAALTCPVKSLSNKNTLTFILNMEIHEACSCPLVDTKRSANSRRNIIQKNGLAKQTNKRFIFKKSDGIILYEHDWIPYSKIHQLELDWWMNAWHCRWPPKHLFFLRGWLTWWLCRWLQKEKPGSAVTQMHHPIPSTSPVPPDAQLFICYVAGIHYISGIFSFITQINSAFSFFKSLGKIVNSLLVPTVSWYSLILFMIPFMIKSCPYPCKIKFQVMNILQA